MHGPHCCLPSHAGVYEGAMEIVKLNVQPFVLQLLKPTLVLRERSAVIEMYQQVSCSGTFRCCLKYVVLVY